MRNYTGEDLKIAITNYTGGRNRGCEALVLSKILGFSKVLENPRFTLHSNDPVYDSWRFSNLSDLRWSYLTNTPNHFPQLMLNRFLYGTIGLFEWMVPVVNGINLKSIAAVQEADLVVASGGDIFTSDYGNLRKHLAYPIIANKKRVYLCGHSIGPFRRDDEDYFLRATDGIAAITAREKESYEYLKAIDVQADIRLTADVAFTLPALDREASLLLLRKRYNLARTTGLVALSISQGIIKYLGLQEKKYYEIFSRFCDALIDLGKVVILVPHVMEKNPDNNDVIACDEVINRMVHDSNIIVLDGEPNASILKGIIGCCECLIGTRTHATIAAMSQAIPTVSVAYSRKAYGIMKDVYGDYLGGRLTIDARELKLDLLMEAYNLAVSSPIDMKHLSSIKTRSESNFSLVTEIFEGIQDG